MRGGEKGKTIVGKRKKVERRTSKFAHDLTKHTDRAHASLCFEIYALKMCAVKAYDVCANPLLC